MGEQELDSEDDYSRAGRVNAMLARRLTLLAEVEKLARGFGVSEDVSYTCETAAHFWLLHILSRCVPWLGFGAHCGPFQSIHRQFDPRRVQGVDRRLLEIPFHSEILCSNILWLSPLPLSSFVNIPPHPCPYSCSLFRWERFASVVDKERTAESISVAFPFKEYFADAPEALFRGLSFDEVG